ncbi:MAG: hypothetical protein ACRED0_02205 [Gammaproteobacteria bacterium]
MRVDNSIPSIAVGVLAHVELESEVERRLFAAGKMRREMCQEIMERNQALHVGGLD